MNINKTITTPSHLKSLNTKKSTTYVHVLNQLMVSNPPSIKPVNGNPTLPQLNQLMVSPPPQLNQLMVTQPSLN